MIVRLNKDLCLNVCASKWKSNQQNWYKKSDFFISDAFCFLLLIRLYAVDTDTRV